MNRSSLVSVGSGALWSALSVPARPSGTTTPTEEPTTTPTEAPPAPDIETEPNTVPHRAPVPEPESDPCERPGTSCPLH
jgi:hypothetical protein